ncbi:MAG: YceI family protein [Cyclobacteriaceae bacterium]
MKKIALLAFAVFLLAAFNIAEEKKATTYKVDPEKSSLAWLGKKVTGQHNGYVNLQEGELILENGKLTGGRFVIDMNSISCEDIQDKSTNQKLVGHLKSDDFFGVSAFPSSRLEIKKVTHKSGNQYEILGHLTIRDKTNPVTFPATVNVNGNKVSAKADITIDRSKFNVKFGSGSFFDNLGDKMIYDDFTLTVNLEGSSANM